jgi:hypothetical protein
MAIVKASLREVDSRRAGGCQKPNCKFNGIVHRHHTKHPAMWFGIWSSRRRHEEKFQEMIEQYYKFAPADCVILCPEHHAEIHRIYDRIISKDRRLLNKPLAKYSWPQAEALMGKLHRKCMTWIAKETPGIDPRDLDKQRALK